MLVGLFMSVDGMAGRALNRMNLKEAISQSISCRGLFPLHGQGIG